MGAHQLESPEACPNGESALSVRSTLLKDFFPQHGIGIIQLLKIDCEGCEEEVMLLAPWDFVQRTIGECHPSRYVDITRGWVLCCSRCPTCQNCPARPFHVPYLLCLKA
eukprot:gnl/MRDRNA2_/MRDRNA2_585388_c0_seq1.p1 gnl/MRDRNA2_/MRDRNA2_585388_c0~~gnl/MRDRNA2_/MRDRNA2_585388_c0_seq1.p1  ORF type:complete len:120 (+),score=6.61 gnl/MRDRNA2_/MRDRNA2_585388_c0_seq1:35-361(+)